MLCAVLLNRLVCSLVVSSCARMAKVSAVPPSGPVVAPSVQNAGSMSVASFFTNILLFIEFVCNLVIGHVSWIGKETWHWVFAVLFVVAGIFWLHNYLFTHRQLGALKLYRITMVHFGYCSHYIGILAESGPETVWGTIMFLWYLTCGCLGGLIALFCCLPSPPSQSEIDTIDLPIIEETVADACKKSANEAPNKARIDRGTGLCVLNEKKLRFGGKVPLCMLLVQTGVKVVKVCKNMMDLDLMELSISEAMLLVQAGVKVV